jgi:hypothetical protein
LTRLPLKTEKLISGVGVNQPVCAIYYSMSDSRGGIEICNLMNGYREILLSESEYKSGYRLSYIFMAFGAIVYCRLHERTRKVDFLRRTELTDCKNKLDTIIKIDNFSTIRPHIRVYDDNTACFLHDYDSGNSVRVDFKTEKTVHVTHHQNSFILDGCKNSVYLKAGKWK